MPGRNPTGSKILLCVRAHILKKQVPYRKMQWEERTARIGQRRPEFHLGILQSIEVVRHFAGVKIN